MLNKIKSAVIYLLLIASLGFAIRYFFLGTESKEAGSQSTDILFNASFPDQAGQSQSLKQYQGKIVVLNFWATWCEPCRDEMPELSALYEELKAKNVVVLGVAIDDVNAIKEFTEDTKVSYPLFAGEVGGMEIASQLGNNKGVLPYTVIIKPDGTMDKVYFGRISKAMLTAPLQALM